MPPTTSAVRPAPPRSRPERRPRRPGRYERSLAALGPGDRAALLAWLYTRLGIMAVSLGASVLWAYGDLRDSFLDRWTQWDVDLFVEIAKYGYAGDPARPPDAGLPAFFPGLPLALRALHPIVRSWWLSALLISVVGGAVAMVALARLGDLDTVVRPGRTGDAAETREAGAGGPDTPESGVHESGVPATVTLKAGVRGAGGRPVGAHGSGAGATRGPKAALALALSPYAVFLFAGYSETLFLAFALPAWLLARRRRWEAAVLCAAGASCVRVTGLFLAVALIVEFVVADRRWRSAPWLAVPFLPMLGYAAYHWRRTGDVFAWQHAQQAGWGRSLTWPWNSFRTTWNAAFAVHDQFTTAFRVELVAAAVGVALTAWLLARRRWAESAYVGLQMASFLTSAFYLSIGRATLLWWPLWLAVGGLRKPAYVAVLALSVPLLAAEVVLFTSGGWAG